MKYVIPILWLALLSSCIPEPVEIEIPQAEPQLVVASQMLFDQAVLVQVSRSFGALDFSEEEDSLSESFLDTLLVSRARVVINHAGIMDTLLHLGAGLYISTNTEFIPMDSYRLSVYDSVSGDQVTAETEVLPQMLWDSLDYAFQTDSFPLGDTVFLDTALSLRLQWTDPPEENYYMVNLNRVSLSQLVDPDAELDLTTLSTGNLNTYPLPDQLYTEAQVRDTLLNFSFQQGDTLSVSLSNISPLYYQYLTTRERSSGNIFTDLLGEPINYPSNIEGGLGMFVLHLPDIALLVLEE